MDQITTLDGNKTPFKINMHQIVAVVFLKPCLGKEVHHMNGISWDNRRQNLKWVTRKENGDYRTGTPVEVIEQGSNKKPLSFLTVTDACKEFKIPTTGFSFFQNSTILDKRNLVYDQWFQHKGKNLFFKRIVSSCFISFY